MWARGYFAVTTGNVTDEMVKQYIESHREPPPDKGEDNFQVDE